MNRKAAPGPIDFLDFLLSCLYDDCLAPEHRADLRKSGLTHETIALQKIRSVPPDMITPLIGFNTPKVVSAYVIPYANPAGGWMPHIRMKIFPPLTDGEDGSTVKYLQPAGSSTRIFFTVATLAAVLRSTEPLWLVEGEKKALAVAQHGLPTVGIAGINAWTARGTGRLHPDFERIPLMGRVVELVPDSDWQTHPRVRTAVGALATALAAAGARPRMVVLPDEVSA